jgi:hypothetical protein
MTRTHPKVQKKVMSNPTRKFQLKNGDREELATFRK